MTGKSPLLSKTLWVNVIAVAVMLVQTKVGFAIDAEYQAAILGVINMVLRIVTREPLDWSKSNQSGHISNNALSVLFMISWSAIVLIGLIALSGCSATSVKTTANKLILTQETVIAAAQAADAMCSAGTLTQTQCDEAAKIYQQAKDAYDVALAAELAVIDAAIAGDDTSEAEAAKAYSAALASFTAVATKMVTFATKYGLLEEE